MKIEPIKRFVVRLSIFRQNWKTFIFIENVSRKKRDISKFSLHLIFANTDIDFLN